MGFGHRVYKNYDPRATIIRKQCHKVLESTGNDSNPMFKLALELERKFEHGIRVITSRFQNFMALFSNDRCSGVIIFINTMSKPH